MKSLLFDDRRQDISGRIDDPGKRPLFTMARLDTIKNITGLVEAFGRSEELKQRTNLIIVAGKVDREEADSPEEKEQIDLVYRLAEEYDLHGSFRWLGIGLSRPDAAEVYRVIADHCGIFVQPALYEAFGLTVLEAMHSGLPTAATRYGGPLEIIREDEDGFLLDVKDREALAAKLLEILDRFDRDGGYWRRISEAGIKRVAEHYNWPVYCRNLLGAATCYRAYREHLGDEQLKLRHGYNRRVFEELYRPLVKRFNSRSPGHD